MIPTPIIERLLATQREGGGTLVQNDAVQILVPVFPPGQLLSFSAGPIDGDYAQIVWGIKFGIDMVPNAFEGFLQMWGHRALSGTFTSVILNTEFQGLQWVTTAEPAYVYVTNVSPLNQIFELGYMNLRIASEEDLRLVREEIEHIATSAKSEQLANEAVVLLRRLAGGR